MKLGFGGWHIIFLVVYVTAYLSQSVYFIGQHKEMNK
jgi:hypothetical protein